MNWPMKVAPAVCAALLGLLALSAGSTMSWTGPRSSGSSASISPPGAPISMSAARSRGLACANGRRSGNIGTCPGRRDEALRGARGRVTSVIDLTRRGQGPRARARV
jgi:hypothetical protein